MNDCNKEWNEKSLAAWNQWKHICSICGCPDEYRYILMVEVANAFYKKLYSVIGKEADSLFDNDQPTAVDDDDEPFAEDDETTAPLETDDGASGEFCGEANKNAGLWDKPKKNSRVDWAHEFDCGIIEKANSETSPKNYKDHTWECIKRSDDPPLKIIRGQLLGRLGIINEIAERFLRNNFHGKWVEYIGHMKQISFQEPLNSDEKGEEEAGTLADIIPGDDPPPQLDPSERNYLRECFKGLFTNDNAAILLVHLSNLSIAMPELRNYVGLSSVSPLYDRFNNVILRKIFALPEECLQALRTPGAGKFLISLLIEQIKPEKEASLLLQKVYTTLERRTEDE